MTDKKEIIAFLDSVGRAVIDKRDEKYERGDDERCPVCGCDLDSYTDLDFDGAVIHVTNYCCECGHALTFNYVLHNVVVER